MALKSYKYRSRNMTGMGYDRGGKQKVKISWQSQTAKLRISAVDSLCFGSVLVQCIENNIS